MMYGARGSPYEDQFEAAPDAPAGNSDTYSGKQSDVPAAKDLISTDQNMDQSATAATAAAPEGNFATANGPSTAPADAPNAGAFKGATDEPRMAPNLAHLLLKNRCQTS